MEEIQKIIPLVKEEYAKLECWIHSWQHIIDVVKRAEDLANLEKVDPTLAIISSYCHDLGRIEEENRLARLQKEAEEKARLEQEKALKLEARINKKVQAYLDQIPDFGPILKDQDDEFEF
jgi:HD superfamily phosphodiesterase